MADHTMFQPYRWRLQRGMFSADMYVAHDGRTRVTLSLWAKKVSVNDSATTEICIGDETFEDQKRAVEWVDRKYADLKEQLP